MTICTYVREQQSKPIVVPILDKYVQGKEYALVRFRELYFQTVRRVGRSVPAVSFMGVHWTHSREPKPAMVVLSLRT